MATFIDSMIACTVNAYTGIQRTRQEHTWLGNVSGTSSAQKLSKIAIPSATPMILTGLRTILNGSWMALMAAELPVSNKGLGFIIQNARLISRPDLIIVGMLYVGMIGLVSDAILEAMEKMVVKGMNAK